MGERVLVTGGAGFIGSFLADELISQGYVVRVFDNLDSQVHTDGCIPDYLSPEAKFIKGDVRDRKALESALRDIDVVFHFAAAVGVGQSQYAIQHYVDVNIGGTAILLDILVNSKNHVRKIVLAASMSSYGEGNYLCDQCGEVNPSRRSEKQLARHEWDLRCPSCGMLLKPIPTRETKAQTGDSVYAITKRVQEDLVLNIGRTYRIPAVALRFFNIYGPRQSLSNPYTGVAAIFMGRIKNDNPPVIYEDGLQTRDFTSVHDVVQACMLAFEKEGADYKAFNVGSDTGITIKQVAETLIHMYDKDLTPIILNQFRKGDIRHCIADISKIQDGLGFNPKVSFKQGMHELVSWANGVEARDKFEQAAAELSKRGLI